MIPVQAVRNLIDFFAVPKGEEDVRLVLNGSSCGLNQATWAPNFWLPTSNSMVRALSYNYKVVDMDLGEMFLNFPLHPRLQAYSGMDLTPFMKEVKISFPELEFPENNKVHVVNTRTWMGFRASPEWACRYYYLAEEFIRGNEKTPNNPLRWDYIVLNMIGAANFIHHCQM